VAARSLSYWDYVKAAFKRRARLPLLGYVPFNYLFLLATGVFGMANHGFWFLGAAVEVAYLTVMAGNDRFQKLVQGESVLADQKGVVQKVQQAVTLLSPPSAERYNKLLDQCRMILGITVPRGRTGMLEDVRAGSLNQILWLFLRLLSSREVLQATLGQVKRESLEQDQARLREKLAQAEPESSLARSLQATLDIQSKRVENLGKAASSLEVIDAELERIERQVKLIREESAVSGGPEFLSAKLDAVSTTLNETSKWMDQHAEFLTTLAGDDLDGESADLMRSARPVEGQER